MIQKDVSVKLKVEPKSSKHRPAVAQLGRASDPSVGGDAVVACLGKPHQPTKLTDTGVSQVQILPAGPLSTKDLYILRVSPVRRGLHLPLKVLRRVQVAFRPVSNNIVILFEPSKSTLTSRLKPC